MNVSAQLSGLEGFAKRCIAAHRYPHDYHTFRLFQCEACGVAAFEVTIEHHTGSVKGDFKGIIWGVCAECGHRTRLFRFTGEHRSWLRDEKPICTCGHESFYVGECERFEGDQGLMGFFDEGVVVGTCSQCGRNRAFVYTD